MATLKKKIGVGVLALLGIVVIGLVAWPIMLNTEAEELTNEVRAQAPGSFATLSDGIVHYELAGPDSGQLVVLVHGFSVPAYIWDPTFAGLAEGGFRVLRYDLFGRGYSDRPETAYDRAFFERQLLDLLDALELEEPVDLIGLSMGGAVIAGFAARYPDKVRKLVFLDPMNQGADVSPMDVPLLGSYLMQVMLAPSMADGQLDDFYDPSRFSGWPERFREQMRYKGFRRAILSTIQHYAPVDHQANFEQVAASGIPTMLIWGKEDTVVPFTDHERVHGILQGELLIVEQTGHIPHYERPDLVNPPLISFLQGDDEQSED